MRLGLGDRAICGKDDAHLRTRLVHHVHGGKGEIAEMRHGAVGPACRLKGWRARLRLLDRIDKIGKLVAHAVIRLGQVDFLRAAGARAGPGCHAHGHAHHIDAHMAGHGDGVERDGAAFTLNLHGREVLRELGIVECRHGARVGAHDGPRSVDGAVGDVLGLRIDENGGEGDGLGCA